MTDAELQSLYRDVGTYLSAERAETLRVRAAQHSNVVPVSMAEAHGARRLLAGGRLAEGVCPTCGDQRLHAHGTVS